MISLGGQPGAGKTKAGEAVQGMHPGRDFVEINGDDYRQYVPGYDRILREDPHRMPDLTAPLAGRWVGQAVDRALQERVSFQIEGTWGNPAMVAETIQRAKQAGYATHAAVVAVPAALSRASILERYYGAINGGRPPRWTPIDRHEQVVATLGQAVEQIAADPAVDRFSILNRDGQVLYDQPYHSARAHGARTLYQRHTDRPLTAEEVQLIEATTARLAPHFTDPTRHSSDEFAIWQELRSIAATGAPTPTRDDLAALQRLRAITFGTTNPTAAPQQPSSRPRQTPSDRGHDLER